jgi:outer membrane protein OmpA-like peptidoglycan-associated protein
MHMRTRPLAALIVSALFSLQVACSSQANSIEESIQPVGEEAPADAPMDAENTRSEADIEKEIAIAEASGSDSIDPSQVQLNGDGSPATPVDPVDGAVAPDAPAMSDIPAPEAPTTSDIGLDSGLGTPASGSVYFAKASSKVSREYREQLKEIAANLKADRSMKVVLVGHCDNRGSAAFNRRLANKRAKAVKAALMKMGVKAKQMSIGAPQLVQSGSTEEEHTQNRRVEIQ